MKNALLYWRKRRFLSMDALEDMTGINISTIRKIERGMTGRVQPKTLRKLVAALKITPEQFWGYDIDEAPDMPNVS